MKLVILESPFAGEVQRNTLYARAALSHSLHLGEAPLASHLLYIQPGVLDDLIPAERELGMHAGWAWRQHADYSVYYIDFGMSSGMQRAKNQVGLHVTRYLPEAFWPAELIAMCPGGKIPMYDRGE